MIIYLLVLLVAGVSSIVTLSLRHRACFYVAIVPSVLLCFFIGLRDKVGGDWDAYEIMLDSWRYVDFSNFLLFLPEPLYAYLNYFSLNLGGGIYAVNFICAVIVIGAFLRFAFLIDANPNLFIFLATPYFLYVVAMGYTRQSVAISLGYLGLGNLMRGHTKKFYLYVLLAMGFHVSAIFLLILGWLKSWKQIFWMVPVIGVVASAGVNSPLARYGELYLWNSDPLQSNGVWFRLFLLLLGSSVMIWQRKHWKQEARLFALLKIGCALTIILIPVGVLFSTLADRICLYLFFLYLIPMERAIRFSSRWAQGLVVWGVFCANFLCFFVWFGISSFAVTAWIPYRIAYAEQQIDAIDMAAVTIMCIVSILLVCLACIFHRLNPLQKDPTT